MLVISLDMGPFTKLKVKSNRTSAGNRLKYGKCLCYLWVLNVHQYLLVDGGNYPERKSSSMHSRNTCPALYGLNLLVR